MCRPLFVVENNRLRIRKKHINDLHDPNYGWTNLMQQVLYFFFQVFCFLLLHPMFSLGLVKVKLGPFRTALPFWGTSQSHSK